MRVLGISPLDKDATASFMEDGQIVFACAEERLSRVKLQDGFPDQAVRLGLERTGWDPTSIDVVAYAFFDGDDEARLMRDALARDARANRPGRTAASLAQLRCRLAADYRVDRTTPIPGIVDDRGEFMPPKSWRKRWVYGAVARHPLRNRNSHSRRLSG